MLSVRFKVSPTPTSTAAPGSAPLHIMPSGPKTQKVTVAPSLMVLFRVATHLDRLMVAAFAVPKIALATSAKTPAMPALMIAESFMT